MSRMALSILSAYAAVVPVYRDPQQPVPARVADLLPKMSVEEKIAELAAPYHTDPASVYTGSVRLPGSVNERNVIQGNAMNSSRLGIPVNFIQEALHGGCKGASVFPMPLTLGASWNTTLVQDVYFAVASDTRACGANIAFAPVINLFSDPRFGRHQEGFSPNPTLTAHLARAAVAGLQGSTDGNATTYLPSANDTVISIGKHFAAYGGATGGLNGAPPGIDERTLRDVYLKPWRAFAGAGGRGAMPSHNTVLDVPAHANSWLINDIFRDELGFGQGLTISDCNDLGALESFRIAANLSQAAALGLVGGTDQDLQCGNPAGYTYTQDNIKSAIAEGFIDEKLIDRAAGRVLTSKFASGMFETPFTDPALQKDFDSPERRALARVAAHQGIVLLKNDGAALPLDDKEGLKIAILGQLGGDSSTARASMLGSYTQDDQNIRVDSVQTAISSATMGSVAFVQGAGPDETKVNQSGIDAATAAAKNADVVIFVVGESLDTCNEWKDRSNLDLPGTQIMLLEAVAEATANSATKLIVLLITGRPNTFGAANANIVLDSIDAVVWGGRPGEEGSNAFADVVFGKYNPSGKIQTSWPRSVGHIGSGSSPWLQPLAGKWISNRKGQSDPDGRRYDNYVQDANDPTPLFYFASGLSYTTFNYSGLKVQATSECGDDMTIVANAKFTLDNTGSRFGEEVTQLYVKDPVGLSVVVRPWKRLAGFQKVALDAGKSDTVSIDVSFMDLAQHDENMQFVVKAGDYTFSVGGSSNGDSEQVTVTVPACGPKSDPSARARDDL